MGSVRRGLTAGLLGGALVLTAAACGPSGSPGGAASAAGTTAARPRPTVPAAVVAIEPKSGATDVKPSGALKVTATGGKLTAVKVTGKDGREVTGALAADGLSWTPAAALAVSEQYTVTARATDPNGLVTTAESGFTTLTPAKKNGSYVNVDDGQTYGVGMIVSLRFRKAVQNRAEAERAVVFETSDGTAVKPHWFGDDRVDFRPAEYWKPGTKVTVRYRLKSAELAPGVYGDTDGEDHVTIGRSRVSTADVATHRMTVVENGQTVDTVKFTAGKAGFDSFNGAMVIEEMARKTRMSSNGVSGIRAGDEYDLDDVPHAMRLTDTGTYVHGNSWAIGSMGRANASHGCIGIADTRYGSDGTDAGRFYNASMIGDVVTVVNSKGPQVSGENGLSGWNVPWTAW
ncbi:Ig-like domain-containing protein [Kitasatospora sp. DSM 101779]|uniref:L,D-transpeptidase n=1 Tax=Kitasatospora sp. DSM 101779 TaxID=2853165 RepID=UPI0021D963A0|nr:Ig-like domain-containing protein [Kitasatospora sp. DSM 101779]MCU7822767.1 L,D-transpeptidase family protein [Kitasatospora sp. DSM 101779]